MKRIHLNLICVSISIFASFIAGCRKSNTAPKTICNSGSVTIATNTEVTGGCIIDGDLTIVNEGILNVDLTNTASSTFVVRGNILLKGNAMLWVHAAPGTTSGQFIVSSTAFLSDHVLQVQ